MATDYKTPQKTDLMVELHVPDFGKAKEFYLSLGFEVVWERKPVNGADGYMVMRRGESIINFHGGTEDVADHKYFGKFPKDSKRGYAVEIIIPIDGIKDFYKQAQQKYPKNIVQPLEKKFAFPDFRMEDPFGFYLRFVDRYNWVETRDKDGKSTV